MKNIQVKDKNASVEVTSKKEIPVESEYLIKALAGIQIMCVDKTSKDDPRLRQVIDIVQQAIEHISDVFEKSEEINNGILQQDC